MRAFHLFVPLGEVPDCIHARCVQCIDMYAYIHTYLHTYMHAYTHIHTYLHTCIHTYTHAYIHTCIHTCIHTYTHAYIHAYMHTYIHAYIHAYIHTYVHTYIHTYMLHAYANMISYMALCTRKIYNNGQTCLVTRKLLGWNSALKTRGSILINLLGL